MKFISVHCLFLFYYCFSLKYLHILTTHDCMIYNLHKTIGRGNNGINLVFIELFCQTLSYAPWRNCRGMGMACGLVKGRGRMSHRAPRDSTWNRRAFSAHTLSIWLPDGCWAHICFCNFSPSSSSLYLPHPFQRNLRMGFVLHCLLLPSSAPTSFSPQIVTRSDRPFLCLE